MKGKIRFGTEEYLIMAKGSALKYFVQNGFIKYRLSLFEACGAV